MRRYAAKEVSAGLVAAFEVEVGGWLPSSEAIANILCDFHPEVILYENFVLAGGASHSSEPEALDSVRVTSAVMALMRLLLVEDVGEFIGFSTSVKAVMTDERMKLWGLWLQGRNVRIDRFGVACRGFQGHATDAARGLVAYLRSNDFV